MAETTDTSSPEFGKSIIHIEDLKPAQLLKFFKQWNLDKQNVMVTEKVDGMFLRIGIDAGGFYLATKNTKFYDSAQIPKLFFFDDIRRYFDLLKAVPYSQIIGLVTKTKPATIELQGEAIPSHDHNIIIYDQNKIGDGIYVVFGVTVNGKSYSDRGTLVKIADLLKPRSSVKFYAAPQADISSFEVPNKLIISLEKLIQTHGNFLASPAKTPEAKELKIKVLALVKKIGMTAKQSFLKQPYAPAFGGDTEGYVLALPDGSLVKIVDKNKFTASKDINWKYMGLLQDAERAFGNAIKKNPASIKAELRILEAAVNQIDKDFIANKQTFTIPRKVVDTEKSMDLLRQKIAIIKRRLLKDAPDKVAADVLSREMNKELTESLLGEMLLPEGGHVFSKVNSSIPKELLKANVANAVKMIGLQGAGYESIGNINKPLLGDVDVGVSKPDLVKVWGVSEDPEMFWQDIDKKLSSLGVEHTINKGLKQFHILVPLIDNTGTHIVGISSTGEQLSEPGYIQIDFFVGQLGWMKNILSGAPADSKHKAVFRNFLLGSIFSSIIWEDKENPEIKNSYLLDLKEGLQQIQYQIIPPGGQRKNPAKKRISTKLVTNDPNKMVQFLFGKGVTWQEMDSYEKLMALLMSSKFKFPQFRATAVNKFKSEIAGVAGSVPQGL